MRPAAPPIRRLVLLIALTLAAAAPAPAAAQETAGRVPQARMDAFVRALEDGDPDSFFPRRGMLTWLLTTRRADGVSVGRWRFDAADLPRALGLGSHCETFRLRGDLIPMHSLHYLARQPGGRWRRAGANRFGLAVYAEAGTEREEPSVLYVPVSAGMYQPYQFMTSSGCP